MVLASYQTARDAHLIREDIQGAVLVLVLVLVLVSVSVSVSVFRESRNLKLSARN